MKDGITWVEINMINGLFYNIKLMMNKLELPADCWCQLCYLKLLLNNLFIDYSWTVMGRNIFTHSFIHFYFNACI